MAQLKLCSQLLDILESQGWALPHVATVAVERVLGLAMA